MKLNEKILYCRRRAGLSQEALAERIGVSRQAISKWETGESSPEITKLPLLAQAFAVTTDWLLDDAASPADGGVQTAGAQGGASSADAPQTRPSCPDWVDKLPDTLARLIRQYGWFVGVRMAIAGALFTAIAFVARAMFSSMSSFASDQMGGMPGGFGGGGVTFYDNAGNMVDPSHFGLTSGDLSAMGLGGSGIGFDASAMMQPADLLTGFVLLLGLIMLVGGVLLAWYLKKWGRENA